MLSVEQMKERINKYDYFLDFEVNEKEVYYLASIGWIKLSYNMALQWINAGITDVGGRSKEKMIDLINSWMEKEK